jgi:hypothetical protein
MNNAFWVVIYFAGKIAAFVGPMSWSVAKCEDYVAQVNQSHHLDYTTNEGVELHGVKYACEFHDGPPIIGTAEP